MPLLRLRLSLPFSSVALERLVPARDPPPVLTVEVDLSDMRDVVEFDIVYLIDVLRAVARVGAVGGI